MKSHNTPQQMASVALQSHRLEQTHKLRLNAIVKPKATVGIKKHVVKKETQNADVKKSLTKQQKRLQQQIYIKDTAIEDKQNMEDGIVEPNVDRRDFATKQADELLQQEMGLKNAMKLVGDDAVANDLFTLLRENDKVLLFNENFPRIFREIRSNYDKISAADAYREIDYLVDSAVNKQNYKPMSVNEFNLKMTDLIDTLKDNLKTLGYQPSNTIEYEATLDDLHKVEALQKVRNDSDPAAFDAATGCSPEALDEMLQDAESGNRLLGPLVESVEEGILEDIAIEKATGENEGFNKVYWDDDDDADDEPTSSKALEQKRASDQDYYVNMVNAIKNGDEIDAAEILTFLLRVDDVDESTINNIIQTSSGSKKLDIIANKLLSDGIDVRDELADYEPEASEAEEKVDDDAFMDILIKKSSKTPTAFLKKMEQEAEKYDKRMGIDGAEAYLNDAVDAIDNGESFDVEGLYNLLIGGDDNTTMDEKRKIISDTLYEMGYDLRDKLIGNAGVAKETAVARAKRIKASKQKSNAKPPPPVYEDDDDDDESPEEMVRRMQREAGDYADSMVETGGEYDKITAQFVDMVEIIKNDPITLSKSDVAATLEYYIKMYQASDDIPPSALKLSRDKMKAVLYKLFKDKGLSIDGFVFNAKQTAELTEEGVIVKETAAARAKRIKASKEKAEADASRSTVIEGIAQEEDSKILREQWSKKLEFQSNLQKIKQPDLGPITQKQMAETLKQACLKYEKRNATGTELRKSKHKIKEQLQEILNAAGVSTKDFKWPDMN